MLSNHLALCILLSSSLFACAAEEGYTPISENRDDQLSNFTVGEEVSLKGECQLEACDMQFTLSVSGVKEEIHMEFMVTLQGENKEVYYKDTLFNRPDELNAHQYDPATETSTWRIPILNSRFNISRGEVEALVTFTHADEQVAVTPTLAWESGPIAVSSEAEGKECSQTVCPDGLQCIKSQNDWSCVAPCFMDAQCTASCDSLPQDAEGLEIEQIERICKED